MAGGGSSGRQGIGPEILERLDCPVPWCQSAVCSAPARYLIAAREEVPPGCANSVVGSEISSRLRRIIDGAEAVLTPGARHVLALRPGSGGPRQVLQQLEEGRLVFLEPRTPRPLRSTPPIRRRQSEPSAPFAGARVGDQTSWIKLQVVDDATSEPLPGVVLHVTQPNGRTFEFTTRADGSVEVNEIDPGVCSVACDLEGARLADTYAFVTMGEVPSPQQSADGGESQSDADGARGAESNSEPRATTHPAPLVLKNGVRIAYVEEHKVRSGESIKSLAEQNGLTWQALALFNWETDVPDLINEKLRDEVGCTKTAPDGVNYRFDDSDDPGLTLIPKPWSVRGLATGQTHTIRVRTETRFYLILENDDKLRIPEAEYEVNLADGRSRKGRLGRGGVAVIKNPPPGELEVFYPDLDDIEAKSLAAAARKAFDVRDPTELHRLFRYPKETIQRAFKAYADHFNDYHGKGLRGDIEEEFGADEEARELFFAYMGAEGQQGAIEEPVQEPQTDADAEADRG